MMMKKLLIRASLILAAAVLACSGYFAYVRLISPTYVGFINYPDYIYAGFAAVNQNRFIKVDRVAWTEKSSPDLAKYHAVYIFGMGLRLSQEQRAQLREAIRGGLSVYVSSATSDETDLSSLSGKELELAQAYLNNGGAENYRQLLNFTRREIDGKNLFSEPVKPAVNIPFDCFFHLAEDAFFESYSDYFNFYRSRNLYKEGAPKICFISTNAGPSSARRGHIDAIIAAFEKAQFNVFPICGFNKRFEFLKQIKPDLVVLMPHGRFAAGQGDNTIDWLKEQNIPLLCPVNVFQPYEQWLRDQRGMAGGILSQSVVMPELDGGIVPYALTAQFPNQRGLYEFQAVPERLQTFTDEVRRFVELKRKKNQDKKIAVVFFKGPGQNALNASGMEVGESLFNFLKQLQQAGYSVDGLPDNAAELLKMIQKNAAVFGPYAKGTEQDFIRGANPELVPVGDYLQWVKSAMPADLYAEVEKQYGPAPGPHMSISRNGKSFLAVSRLRFGNVAIMPQPLPGYGDDTSKIIHGAKAPPPHPYIGAYLWAKYGFAADALIHFGTHGSLEFTPWKQVALSQYDWPDTLTGGLPHFYLYTINNIGEAMIAKRRSYATLVSHLTPPFMTSGLYDELSELHDKIHQCATVEDPLLRRQYETSIIALAASLNLGKDLELPPLPSAPPLPPEALEKIHNYIHGIEEAKVTRGSYVLGRSYSQEEAAETARLMTVDSIAQSLARLDLLKGKISEADKDNRHYFDQRYRQLAERTVTAILNHAPLPGQLISDEDRKLLADGNDKHSPDDIMGAMTSIRTAAAASNEKNAVKEISQEQLAQLLLRICENPDRMRFIESLSKPAAFDKAAALTDPASLRKARQIAKLIPEMRQQVEMASQEDIQQLLRLMRSPEQRQSILKMLEDRELRKKLAAAQQIRETVLINKCLNSEHAAALECALDSQRLSLMTLPSTIKSAAEMEQQISQLKKLQLNWKLLLENLPLATKAVPLNHAKNANLNRLVKSDGALRFALDAIQPAIERLEQQYADYRHAVQSAHEAISNVAVYRQALLDSTGAEQAALLNALNGGYIEPSSGGDPLINPKAVPTGKNMFAIDAERTPSREAWETGRQLGEALIAATLKKENRNPRKAAFTLWGGEFIRSHGVDIAEILFLLGAEPVWNSRGTVVDVKLIAMEKLKRPRIDVVVQTSGQFRDAAASRLYLIDKAVRLAAADGKENMNYVMDGNRDAEKRLLEKGFSPLEARKLAAVRIFGGVNGNYGTNIMGMAESGDRWEKSEEIAERYMQNMGTIYTQDQWCEFVPGVMEAALQNTDTVIQQRSSNTSGPISLDHVYEFMGGINLAVRKATGKDPRAYFNDLRNPVQAVLQDAREAAMTEARTTLLNPKYIAEMMQEGPSSAETFAETFRNVYGWEVMKPAMLDDYLWEDMKQVYIDDRHKLGVKAYFEQKNPYALQEMTAVMLETIRKGYWNADQSTRKQLAELHVKLIKDHKPGCSGFVCDNSKLQTMISSLLDNEQSRQIYGEAIEKVRTSNSPTEKVSGMHLQKEEKNLANTTQKLIKNNMPAIILTVSVIALFLLAVILGRRK
ncbi:MAG: cobaltochelatase subunit CobN [Victivallaceae bacterium]